MNATDDDLLYKRFPHAYFSYTGYAKNAFKDDAMEMKGLEGNNLHSIVGIPIEIVKQRYKN